jgi:hypothetical protein
VRRRYAHKDGTVTDITTAGGLNRCFVAQFDDSILGLRVVLARNLRYVVMSLEDAEMGALLGKLLRRKSSWAVEATTGSPRMGGPQG